MINNQLRQGLESSRNTIIPAIGELIYTTYTKKVYIGDGVTIGGILLNQDILTDITIDGGQIIVQD